MLWNQGVVTVGNQNYITIDGGSNGIIEATANGTGLANSNLINGILIGNSVGVTVQNLTIQNLYVNISGPDTTGAANGNTGVNLVGSFGNITVTNCTFHDMSAGIMAVYYAGCSNVTYTHSTAYRCNWGGAAGPANSSAWLNGLTVDHCRFYNWTNWDDNSNNNHHNGFYAWASEGAGGVLSNLTYTANHVGPQYGLHQTSGLYVSGNVNNVLVNNNVFDASDGTSAATGQLYVFLHDGTSATTASVLNNTFIGGFALNLSRGFGSNLTTYVCNNNSFLSNALAVAIFDNTNATTLIDYNNIYGSGSATPFSSSPTASGFYYSFAGWQAIGYDAHSVTNNPNLSGSYQPQAGSALIGAGTNLSSFFTTDFAGNPRPATGNWTIGAFEYVTPPPRGSIGSLNVGTLRIGP